MYKLSILFCFCFLSINSSAQKDYFKNHISTEADSLRGMLRPERTCYDVHYYDLNIKVNIKEKSINGFVDIYYQAMEDFSKIQIDLYQNMEIDNIVFSNQNLTYKRKHNAVFIDFPKQSKDTNGSFRVYYHGQPTIAKNPPWGGGFVWDEDYYGSPWIGVACEGDGASLWWPNKDHLSDEPDSMMIRVTIPSTLQCIANGNLVAKKKINAKQTRFDWRVSYPINNYNVTINIADYAHFSDTYIAADGSKMPMDYYVLKENLEKAKTHFQQTQKVLACYERYFGKYPFWNDGFALVETPYLGMEHQGAIAYGNKYQRGYLGGMIPRGMNWDYIIVHETGHEYFGNSISCKDMAEVWIHESFTTYMEALYVECSYDYDNAIKYLASQKGFINNKQPIIGLPDVNWAHTGGSDEYFKGAWVLHTLRHAINDDELWFDLLKSFYDKYALSTIETADFINYVNTCTHKDFTAFFEQYLYHPHLPILRYSTQKKGSDLIVRYKWEADVKAFDMPILLGAKENYNMVYPNSEWKETIIKNLNSKDFKIAKELFLIETKRG